MGAVHGLGRRGVALGATIAIIFGFGAGVLAARWSEAEASQGAAVVPSSPPATTTEPEKPAAPEPDLSPSPAPGVRRTCGSAGPVVRYRVTIEDGLPATVRSFAGKVSRVLCDERGWIASGTVRFRYDPRGDVRIHLASAETTERRCLALIGLSVREKWSCAARSRGQVVLNADRWYEGSPSWPGGVARYRAMLINHEMGHIIGFGHHGCPSAGSLAPVMMQQSKGLLGCRPNPWPTAGELRAVG